MKPFEKLRGQILCVERWSDQDEFRFFVGHSLVATFNSNFVDKSDIDFLFSSMCAQIEVTQELLMNTAPYGYTALEGGKIKKWPADCDFWKYKKFRNALFSLPYGLLSTVNIAGYPSFFSLHWKIGGRSIAWDLVGGWREGGARIWETPD